MIIQIIGRRVVGLADILTLGVDVFPLGLSVGVDGFEFDHRDFLTPDIFSLYLILFESFLILF